MADNSASQNTNKFNMNGKPVLVQNNSGIYYGTLEKLDTRDGTVLLSDGYAITPKKHITYAQLYHVLKSESMKDTIKKLGKAKKKDQDILADLVAKTFGGNIIDYAAVDYDLVQSLAEGNTITDYAINGIARYDTVHDKNYAIYGAAIKLTDVSSLTVPIISLTGVTAVLPISDTQEITVRDGNDEDDDFHTMPVIETFVAAGKNTIEWVESEGLRRGKFVDGKFHPDEDFKGGKLMGQVTTPRLIAFRFTGDQDEAKAEEK